MPFDRTQTVFSTGELDPRLHARIDIDRYRTALAKARDIVLTPQGPVRRRPGTVLDDDADEHPTWLLPFQLAEVTVGKSGGGSLGALEQFDWTGATVGNEAVSDNQIDFDAGYDLIHVKCTVTTDSTTTSDFRLRLEFRKQGTSEWVSAPYAFVPKESTDAQQGAGGNLVTLSESGAGGVEAQTFDAMRCRVDEAPDASFSVDVTFSTGDTMTLASSALERSTVRLAPFNVSESEQFLIAFTDRTATIFERETAASGERQLIQRGVVRIDHTDSEISSLDYVQAFDTMIVVHENHRPIKIVRRGDARQWTTESVSFTSDFVVEPEAVHIPQQPVNDSGADNTGQAAIWTIDFENLSNNDRYQLAADGEFTREKSYDVNTPSNNTSAIQSSLNDLPGFSGTFSVSYIGGNEFEISYDFPSDLSLKPVISDFDGLVLEGTGIIAVWQKQKGIEHSNDKWSNALGWPRAVTLYQDRLWLAGSPSYPDEIWGSRVGDLFSFWNAENLDNEAILAQIRSRQLLNIRAIYPGRNLQFFTDAAEFFAPQSLNDPLTPNQFVITRATNRGIDPRVRPVEVTGATLFIETNGEAMREFLFVDTEQSYNAQDVSLLSSHLLVNPQSMKRWPASGGQEFDIVLVPNGTDGDMALFGSLRDQDIAGWWSWSGDWLDVEVMRDVLHGALSTTINGDPVNVLCRFDDDAFMDLLTADPAVDQTISDGVIDNLYIHKGRDVQIRVDGSYFGEATLDEGEDSRYTAAGNPQIDLDTSIDSSYQLGQKFTPKIKQLPTVIEVGGGSLIWMDRKKRVMGGVVDVRDTAALELATLNDESNAERYASVVTISQNPPETTTGRIVFSGRLGWDDQAAVTITQPLPYPMQVLAIQTRIDL